MEAYKQEFIDFMVDCDEIWRIHIKEWKKVPILHECGSICDWFTA